MNPGFFKSLWRLIYSQLESFDESTSSEKAKKLVKDLFSTTFGKSVEFAEDEEKMKMGELLKERACQVASRAEESSASLAKVIEKAMHVISQSLMSSEEEKKLGFEEFSNAVFSSDSSEDNDIFQHITSPVTNRVLSGYFPNVDEFISRVEEMVISPILKKSSPEEEYKKPLLLSSCPVLVTSIESAMELAIRDMDEWCHSASRTGADIELVFFALLNSPKIGLFRQLPKTPSSTALREQFLAVLAMSLRLAHESAPTTVEELQRHFFFIPKVGIVMDRWLDKEILKYNQKLVTRLNELIGSKNVRKIEEIRLGIRGCFATPSAILLPFGGNIDGVIGQFFEADDFTILPCVMTAETVRTILTQIGNGFFQFDDINPDKVSLTELGAKHVVSAVSAPSSSAGVSQPQVSAGNEDLIDILLRELLQRLPEHVFLHRSHPVKVQPGVYRFGAREVTFHTKGGALYVYRVGDYVSESDGVEFVAREFGVSPLKLKAAGAAGAAAPAPPVSAVPNFEGPTRFHEDTKRSSNIVAGMRRPMDWDNDELMFRIIRRGLKANDRVWREGWYSFCRIEGVSQDARSHRKEVLAKFLEQNMPHAARQEWAKNLLYYMRDDDTSFPPLSEGEDEEMRGRQTTGVHVATTGSGPSYTSGRTGASPADHPNYKTRMCLMFSQGRCTRGASCGFAHGEAELRPGVSGTISVSANPAQFYKTRMCNAFLEGRCSRGAGCSYAHSEAERVASASGVPRRDIKITEDLRLAEKRKAMMQHGRSPSPAPAPKTLRTSRHDDTASSKPLPYIAPSRKSGRRDGSRVDENEL